MINQGCSKVDQRPLAVVKVGGDILLDEIQRVGLAKNLIGLIRENWRVVVLHGGGPQLSAMQSRCGIEPRKVAWLLVTIQDFFVLF